MEGRRSDPFDFHLNNPGIRETLRASTFVEIKLGWANGAVASAAVLHSRSGVRVPLRPPFFLFKIAFFNFFQGPHFPLWVTFGQLKDKVCRSGESAALLAQ